MSDGEETDRWRGGRGEEVLTRLEQLSDAPC